jgi:hypothetical protein
MCSYHHKKRRRTRKHGHKLIYKQSKRRTQLGRHGLPPHPTPQPHCQPTLSSLPHPNESDFPDLDCDWHPDEEEEPTHNQTRGHHLFTCQITDLNTDELEYFKRLTNPPKYTRIDSSCVCFPDVIIDDKRDTISLSTVSFIHAYQSHRKYGPNDQKTSTIAPECDCEETNKLNNMLAEGFDTKEHTFSETLNFFEINDICIHNR